MIKIIILLAVVLLGMDLFFKIIESNNDEKPKFVHQGAWECNLADGFVFYHCNVCMNEALFNSLGIQVTSRYCPHCGSWMCDDDGNVLVDP